MRRMTRLTNAFSKKVENLEAAVGLHFAHYNFVRLHRSLRITPAMAANVTDRLWSMEELIERIDAMAPAPKPRGPYKTRRVILARKERNGPSHRRPRQHGRG